MGERVTWDLEGRDWPNRTASRFVSCTGLHWHVQRLGQGPQLLLLHGTGAATHSWSGLLPLLAERFEVVAPDLPGHGFTDMRPSGLLSLPYVARSVAALMTDMDVRPDVIVGHSAGAAVAAELSLAGLLPPRHIISLNGALLPFPGMLQPLASGLAKLLFLNPLVPRFLSWRVGVDPGRVETLLARTGSRIAPQQRQYYERLFASRRHVDAALAMMANWDLDRLAARLPDLDVPLTLVAAERDAFVPPDIAERVATLVPGSELMRLSGLGHLAHEEAPERIAEIILQAVDASESARARAAS